MVVPARCHSARGEVEAEPVDFLVHDGVFGGYNVEALASGSCVPPGGFPRGKLGGDAVGQPHVERIEGRCELFPSERLSRFGGEWWVSTVTGDPNRDDTVGVGTSGYRCDPVGDPCRIEAILTCGLTVSAGGRSG